MQAQQSCLYKQTSKACFTYLACNSWWANLKSTVMTSSYVNICINHVQIGLEHHIPLLVDICSPLVGLCYLDHSICSLVLHGVITWPRHLRRVTSPCPICLWSSVDRWRIANTRSNRNFWLLRAGAEEMAISLFARGSSSKNVLPFFDVICKWKWSTGFIGTDGGDDGNDNDEEDDNEDDDVRDAVWKMWEGSQFKNLTRPRTQWNLDVRKCVKTHGYLSKLNPCRVPDSTLSWNCNLSVVDDYLVRMLHLHVF